MERNRQRNAAGDNTARGENNNSNNGNQVPKKKDISKKMGKKLARGWTLYP